MLDLTLLEPLVHASLDLFAESIHLICLLLNKSGLCSNDLLVSLLHIAITLLIFHLNRLDLDLVSLSILLLSRELTLDGLQVQELSRQLESKGKLLFEHLTVLLKIADVALLKSTDGLLILLLDLSKSIVPSLIEVLVLHQMSLLDLFSLAGLIINQLFTTAIVILNLELRNAVLGHLCLNILALHLALFTMLFQDSTIR